MILGGKCNIVLDSEQEIVRCLECKSLWHLTCDRLKRLDARRKLPPWKCDAFCTEANSVFSLESESNGGKINQLIETIKCMWDDMKQQFKVVNDNVSGVKKESTINVTIDMIKTSLNSSLLRN